jgi:hypothetical protein
VVKLGKYRFGILYKKISELEKRTNRKETMKEELEQQGNEVIKTSLEYLLRELSEKIKEHHASNDYNIFKALELQNNETLLHSNFIASLLDPNGIHNQSLYFLEKFLAQIKLITKHSIIITESTSIKIRKEYPLGDIHIPPKYIPPKYEPTGGRLDLLININDKYIIAVENKIFAIDQPYQLARYYNSLKEKFPDCIVLLFYLTPTGKPPCQNSISQTKEGDIKLNINKDFYILSYKEHILNWLNETIIQLSDDRLKDIVEQYITIIKELIKRFIMLNTVEDLIFSKSDEPFNIDINMLRSVFFIGSNYLTIQREVVNRLIKKIEARILTKPDVNKEDPVQDNEGIIVKYKVGSNTLILKYLFSSAELYYGVKGTIRSYDSFDSMENNTKSSFTLRKKSSLFKKNTNQEATSEIEAICNDLENLYKEITK